MDTTDRYIQIKFIPHRNISEAAKTHQYYIRRRHDHLLPLYLERKRDLLNEKTLDFDYVELVTIRNVDGDIFVSWEHY